jgi:hypothetical protein
MMQPGVNACAIVYMIVSVVSVSETSFLAFGSGAVACNACVKGVWKCQEFMLHHHAGIGPKKHCMKRAGLWARMHRCHEQQRSFQPYLGFAWPTEKPQMVLQIVMLLPTQLPVDPNNMNYTCVTVGAVMILVMGAWYLPFWGAKNWVSRQVPSQGFKPSESVTIMQEARPCSHDAGHGCRISSSLGAKKQVDL